MKTLQIGDDWPDQRVNGLNRYFVELSHHLLGAGVGVHGLVVGPPEIEQQTQGSVTAFAHSHDPLWKRLYRVRQAVHRLRSERQFDLLASHFALYTAPLGATLKEVPLVVHFHGPWAAESEAEGAAACRSRFKLNLERNVYRQARRLIVLSRSFQEELVSRYGIDERLTRIIPGGIDTDRFNIALTKSEARRRLGWDSARPIILTVRRQVRRMGLENLIDAVERVARRFPDILLLLGGTGPIGGELHAKIEARQLQRNVRRLGRVSEDDLPVAYRAADMTVVPSQKLEGFGLITLESLASGTPVLVTPVGGLPEVIRPLAPQCIFSGQTVQEMAELLEQIVSGGVSLPSETQCREYAISEFAWPLIAGRVREIYDEALRS